MHFVSSTMLSSWGQSHRCFCSSANLDCVSLCETQAVDVPCRMSNTPAVLLNGAVDAWCVLWWRHEQKSVAAVVETLKHHSASRRVASVAPQTDDEVPAATRAATLAPSPVRVRGTSSRHHLCSTCARIDCVTPAPVIVVHCNSTCCSEFTVTSCLQHRNRHCS